MEKPKSIYKNKPEEKNLMEGKTVRFIYDQSEPKNADGVCGHLTVIGNSEHKASIYEKVVKRALDTILSFCALIILSPVFLAISLWIYIDDPGPILFVQKRIGKNKRYFKLHKFRSMKMSTPHDVPTHQLDNPDQYITRAGKFLRSHSLDELPQIWDIFLGNMSIIGPRPGLWNQDLLTAERDRYEANDIKPGLTGWSQINGRDELGISEKARLDGIYVTELMQGGWRAIKMDMKCFYNSLHVFRKDESIVEGIQKR
ncbi:sugar transferase [Erysipelotrichaceae bacterium RD49]|nr:sugar transferase [Erysipelotrichaceae bacterium RD49]